MKLKYVRHETMGFVLFPADTGLFHRHIGNATRSAGIETGNRGKLISAGFVYISPDGVYIEGRSESLNLGPAPDDEAALKKQLGWFKS